MTHPIDPKTPEVLTARFLWDAAKQNDVLHFLGTWERLIAQHARDLEEVQQSDYEHGYDMGYQEGHDEGHEDGMSEGYDVGYEEAWREAKEKIRTITGERITPDS